MKNIYRNIFITILITAVTLITILGCLGAKMDNYSKIAFVSVTAILLFNIYFLLQLFDNKLLEPLFSLKNDINMPKDKYYKNDLSKLSPMIKKIILGESISTKNTIAAMTIYMKNRGWNPNKKADSLDLLPHEKAFNDIYEYVKQSHKIGNTAYGKTLIDDYKDIVFKDAYNQKLVNVETEVKNHTYDYLLIYLLIIFNILFTYLIPSEEVSTFLFLIIWFVFFIIMYMLAYSISNALNLKNYKYLTKSGKELFFKLKCSKKYLKNNFESIKKNDTDSIINIILFNIENKFNSEAKKYIDKEFKISSFANNRFNRYILKIFKFIMLILYLIILISLYFSFDLNQNCMLILIVLYPLISIITLKKYYKKNTCY